MNWELILHIGLIVQIILCSIGIVIVLWTFVQYIKLDRKLKNVKDVLEKLENK